MSWVHKARNPGFWLPNRQPTRGVRVKPSRLQLGQGFMCLQGAPHQIAPGANDVNIVSTVQAVATEIGNGLVFSGSGNVWAKEGAQPPASFTMEALIKVGAVQAEPICGYVDNGNPGTTDRELYLNADGTATFYVYDFVANSAKLATSTQTVTAGGIYHLIGRSDGSNLYLNFGDRLDAATACGFGYNAYSNAQFNIGYQVRGGTGSGTSVLPTSTVIYSLVWYGAMTDDETLERYLRPFDFLIPLG